MNLIRFECDEDKERINRKKHRVSFREAESVFYDENARLIYDPEHSEDEDRYVMLGMSMRLRLLVVCHCYREEDNVIRIISARKAVGKEKLQYTERMR
jgi:uncharacterized DUF497 family protein